MSTPRYTVIIPMRRFCAEEPVLLSLKASPPPIDSAEIFVVEGNHPARQRNAALECAHGEIVVFLDNDCRLSPQFWRELETAFARPEVEIVGGPALLRPEAGDTEQIFHALLTHPFVVGPVCSRYAARGEFRAATQTELILCNLAARRSLFSRIGPLSTQLFPNEENEWLDRAQVAGAGIYYNPQQQIFRPQRSTWSEFLRMLFRYGSGRTRQFWVSGWRATHYQFVPLIWLIPVAAIILGPKYVLLLVAGWSLGAIVVGLTADAHLKVRQRFLAGLAAPLIPFTYALGQLFGWPALLQTWTDGSSEITVRNSNGEMVVTPSHSGSTL